MLKQVECHSEGLSELIGLNNLISETMHVKPTMTLRTDSSACKGMILRHGTGKDKQLSVKQLWSQEAACAFQRVQRKTQDGLPRTEGQVSWMHLSERTTCTV